MIAWESDGRPDCFLRFGRTGAQARIRLYCFSHAGATAAIYAPWATLLAPEIEVCAVEQPGHGTRIGEDPLEEVDAMVQQFLPQLCDLQTDRRPFAFYGHSLGAVVAYEAALALRALEHRSQRADNIPRSMPLQNLQHLFVGAARAPHLPPVLPALSHLDQNAFIAGVKQRYGGISEAVLAEPELLEMILPPMRADFRAYETYRHDPDTSLSSPVTAFAGELDPVVQEAAVAAWADHTSGPFRFHRIPGDHFFLAEHREQILGILSRSLLTDEAGMSSESGAGVVKSGLT